MSSEKHYEYAPKDLSAAGGGVNILSKGFDAKAIASIKFILATRRNSAEKNYRDKLIEEVWEKHLETCLYQPYEFWSANPIVFSNIIKLSKIRAMGQDMLVLLAQRHPPEKAFALAAAKGMIDSYRGCQLHRLEATRNLLKPILEAPQSFFDTVNFLDFLKSTTNMQSYAKRIPSYTQDYAHVFYGYSCAKLLERKINGISDIRMSNLLRDFLNYGLINPIQSEREQEIIPTVKQAITSLLLKEIFQSQSLFPSPAFDKCISFYYRSIIEQKIRTVLYQAKNNVSYDTPEQYEKENLRLLRELIKK